MSMTPREISNELDKHIIGQDDAKRAVAIALRNRWRRMQVAEELRPEITPKNILMIGPTGVGKTEIARRLAKLVNAPFIKVEATKFTEVGYVGRDVESIIRDLAERAIKLHHEQATEKVKSKAQDLAEERILDYLLPPASNSSETSEDETEKKPEEKDSAIRQKFRKQLREGTLNDKEIEVDIPVSIGVEILTPPGMEDMTNQLQSMFEKVRSDKKKRRKMKIKDALRIMTEEEASKLVNDDDLRQEAIDNVEQNGIVFIDEIDKVAKRQESQGGGDVSREGVQRDLLPLVEGCTVTTKYGPIKTDHILFIASGAFHYTKPSDLVAELQGRLPIRVELKALTTEDFIRILTEPKASLVEQYTALLATEGVTVEFKADGVKRIAEVAWHVNEATENIGARRLHTVMERLLDKISYSAPEHSGESFSIDADYVNEHLDSLSKNEDLSRYIL